MRSRRRTDTAWVPDPAWLHPERAQALLKELSDLRAELTPWQTARERVHEALDLLDRVEGEGDDEGRQGGRQLRRGHIENRAAAGRLRR